MAKPCFYIDGKYLTNEEMLDWASKQDISKIGKILPEFSHPNTPFKKTDQWVNLAARRMMRYAAENGFDRIAWTNGKQQADRYKLSTQIDNIEIDRAEHNGGWLVTGYKNDKDVFNEFAHNPQELESYIGKDLAQKIVNDEIPAGTQKTYSGVDLELGGSGMKAFYDGIVPSAMSKLGKPFGAKVENVFIPQSEEYEEVESQAQLNELIKDAPNMEQQSLPVTESMKKTASEGMPLFQIIGEYGAANLDKAEESATKLDNLRVAKEMEATKTAKEIRLATGWEKGVEFVSLFKERNAQQVLDYIENLGIIKKVPC